MNQIDRIFISFLFLFDWYVLIGFGQKWKINNIWFILPVQFIFFFKKR